MSSINIAWFQYNQEMWENNRHPYLWLIIEEADIYHNRKSSYIFIYAQLFIFLCTFNRKIKLNKIEHQNKLCIILECMATGDQYFWSKWHTSVQATTPLHGGTANRLKSVIYPHCWYSFLLKCRLIFYNI